MVEWVLLVTSIAIREGPEGPPGTQSMARGGD